MQFSDPISLEQAVKGRGLVLVDNCYLTGDNDLADRLFEVRTPLDFVALKENLDRERYEVLWKLANVIRNPQVFSVERIVNQELDQHLSHLSEVYNFNHNKIAGKRPVRRSPGRKSRRVSFSREDFSESADWNSREVREALRSLNQYSLAINQVKKEFKIYAGKSEPVKNRSWPASDADYSLVEAVSGYVIQNLGRTAAILTSDFDIPYILNRNGFKQDRATVFFPALDSNGIRDGRNLCSLDYEANRASPAGYQESAATDPTVRVITGGIK